MNVRRIVKWGVFLFVFLPMLGFALIGFLIYRSVSGPIDTANTYLGFIATRQLDEAAAMRCLPDPDAQQELDLYDYLQGQGWQGNYNLTIYSSGGGDPFASTGEAVDEKRVAGTVGFDPITITFNGDCVARVVIGSPETPVTPPTTKPPLVLPDSPAATP